MLGLVVRRCMHVEIAINMVLVTGWRVRDVDCRVSGYRWER